MDLGRKIRDEPRKEKLKVHKQRNDTRFEDAPQPKRMNFIASSRDTEYVESSHPSVLARGTGATTLSRCRHGSQPHSKRDSGDRRPCTPVPSLISSDTMSPPSISTISPTTPVFDTGLSRPSMTRSSHNRHPTPLDFDKSRQKKNQSPPEPGAMQPEFDPASTYQPRRMVPINPSVHGTTQNTYPASTEETSFIEWDDDDDDDSSRLQRMKQSLNFTRPHRPNKPTPIQSKSLDKQLNAIPRVLRSPKSPQLTLPTHSHVPQPRSLTYDTTQQRPLPNCVPTSSEQARYLPSSIPPHPIQSIHPHPQTRYTGINPPIPQNMLTPASNPVQTQQDPLRLPYTSQPRPIRHPIRPKQDKDHISTNREEEYSAAGDNMASKSNRIKEIVRGVAKRVSRRDLRKEAATGARK